jgi:hypothetical protein
MTGKKKKMSTGFNVAKEFEDFVYIISMMLGISA